MSTAFDSLTWNFDHNVHVHVRVRVHIMHTRYMHLYTKATHIAYKIYLYMYFLSRNGPGCIFDMLSTRPKKQARCVHKLGA